MSSLLSLDGHVKSIHEGNLNWNREIGIGRMDEATGCRASAQRWHGVMTWEGTELSAPVIGWGG